MISLDVDGSVIQDLLGNPFSRITLIEKVKMIKDIRPCPPLSNLNPSQAIFFCL
jgi:hypothetical protein